MIVPQIAGLTTISSSGQPCAASSSQTAAMSPIPPPPAAVLLGDVDAEVPVLADLQPQVGGLAARAGLLREPLSTVLRREPGHGRAQLLPLLGLAELIHPLLPPMGSTTARTSPAATCAPGRTSISLTVPAYGALTGCCIFIASSTSTGASAATRSPLLTATLTTVPGIGASRLPLRCCTAGSVNRGRSTSRACPSGPSTSTAVPSTRTAYVAATPSSTIVTASGATEVTSRPSNRMPSR